jgi:hypothetical protein
MSPSASPTNGPTPAQRLAAIGERQQRLLAELDRLNERIESAISLFSGAPSAAATAG